MTEQFRPTVIRNKAWETLSDKWMSVPIPSLIMLLALVPYVLLMILQKPITALLGLAYLIFVVSVIGIGYAFTFLDVARGKAVNTSTIQEPNKRYSNYLVGFLLVTIYTFLWSLLLWIPGIIRGIAYSQTFYIMRENPEMSPSEAIDESMRMMEGHKKEYFLLALSFIGWIFLGALTFYIGMLWIMPYISTAQGEFHERVKADYIARGGAVNAPAPSFF